MPKDNVFDKNVESFIKDCHSVLTIDDKIFYSHIHQAILYYKGLLDRDVFLHTQKLEEIWYRSLKKNRPDYSIYESDIFLSEAWACWVVYSRKYLKALQSPKSLFGKSIIEDIGLIHSVADLGCGCGLTTAALKCLFPKAKVYGTNIENSPQWKIALQISKQNKFMLCPDIFSISHKHIDLIFASEYFEHIEDAIDHLIKIINHATPKALIIANAFGVRSVGHFISYKYGNNVYDGKTTSRLFNRVLREMGYEKIKTSLWNNRPSYWRKIK